MTSSIAVCLLTSGRPEYTETTLRTFSQHNSGRDDLLLLHADDGSADQLNIDLARAHGFRTVHRSPVRTGGIPALRAMWTAAWQMGARRILHLENDFEWVGAVPDIEWPCVRLYGEFKGRGALHEATRRIDLVTRKTVDWQPHHVPGWERGLIHMGGPPSIVDIDLLMPRIERARVLKDIGMFTIDTIRPVENIVWHIGAITTGKAPC